jgi:hypothetical protein
MTSEKGHKPTMTRRAKHPRNSPARMSTPARRNIPLYRNSDLSYTRNTPARDKGRIAIVTNRGLGCDGRDGVGRNGHCRAALAVSNGVCAYDTTLTASSHGFGREHTPALEATCEDVRGRRSRVVLTPGVCASSPAVIRRPNRARASVIGRATGAIVQRSPGRARRTPLKPFAQGRPGDPARPVVHPVCISTAHGLAGASRRPAFPAPLSFSRAMRRSKTRATCAARMRPFACCLKRELESDGLAPWLRHCEELLRRRNPDCLRGMILDCFAALAMTLR